jgi:hypothetical protein
MPAMRPIVLALAVLLLAAVAWLAFAASPPVAIPAETTDTPAAATPQQPAPAQQGDRIGAPLPPAQIAPTAPTDAKPAGNATPAPQVAEQPNLVLSVRDMVSRQPVAAFRWRFQNSRGTWQGDGKDGRADVALEPSAVGTLLVEAAGLSPLTKEGVIVPTPPQPALQLDLFLPPLAAQTGITLLVHDAALRPIARARVDAFKLADRDASDWHLGRALWMRIADAADGRYALPALEPASYGLSLQAVDAAGEPLPLLPYRRVFDVTGSNGFLEDVPLEAGALLGLEIVDAAGQGFDPARQGATRLSLHLAGAPHVARKWLNKQGGATASAIDAMPGVGRVELADAIVPGPYELEVLVNGAVRTKQPLFLRAGFKNEERIVVP